MPYAPSINQKHYQHPARDNASPIRILHVVGRMDRGGVETWLMHVLRHIDRDRFQMDFLVHTTEPSAYDDELRALGSRLIPCLHPSHPLRYAANFKRILHDYGPYDIVHSHVHYYSGYILRLAEQTGVPIRIAHSHLNAAPLEVKVGLLRYLYLELAKRLINRHATIGLGCSDVAAIDLFGQNWQQDFRRRLLYCGIDMAPFHILVNAAEVRTEFGIPTDALVIGHVGRFQAQKNHHFLVKIFGELTHQHPKSYLLLVGEGHLRSEIAHKVEIMGLADRVIFTGSRSDIPRLMLGAMDVFLLPSLSEGLPIVGLEAQAAGLPVILSDEITDECQKIKSLVYQISLSEPPSVWAKVVLEAGREKQNISQIESLIFLENSEFNIFYSIKELTEVYGKKCV